MFLGKLVIDGLGERRDVEGLDNGFFDFFRDGIGGGPVDLTFSSSNFSGDSTTFSFDIIFEMIHK